jgi:hypothetical protein
LAPRLRFNEGKACDAILRRLELACEIGDRLFAIEHTGIEPFAGHMQLEAEPGVHFRPIETMVAGHLTHPRV